MSELKLCPFCGGKAEGYMYREPATDHFPEVDVWRIRCQQCYIGAEGVPTKALAIEKWNARASIPDPASAQSIQRYSMETTKRGLRCVLYCKDDSGDYVKYSDHIQARPDPAREALVGALKACRKRLNEIGDKSGWVVTDALRQADAALAEQGHKGATNGR